MKEVNAPICGKENELLGYLYGELSETESLDFQRHAHHCESCKRELAGLHSVRESVIAWRNESLAGVALTGAMAYSHSATVSEKPSALAAMRQFFNLAPLWMKGAVAFASILFCLFAGLAIARLREAPVPAIVDNSNSDVQSEEKLNALVQQRVQQELQRIKESSEVVKANDAVNPPESISPREIQVRPRLASNDPIQKARRPLSKTEREQLAADLRLVSASNEIEFDLLDDGINQ